MDNLQNVRFESMITLKMIELGCYDSLPEYLTEHKNKDIEALSKATTKNDYFSINLFNSNKKQKEYVTEKLAGKNDANTAGPCPRCGTERFKVTAQRRSMDEPMNHEIHCPGCRKIEFN